MSGAVPGYVHISQRGRAAKRPGRAVSASRCTGRNVRPMTSQPVALPIAGSGK